MSAPNAAVAALAGLGEAKSRLHGCIASLLALNTVWRVGRATYLPELSSFAGLNVGALDKVTALFEKTEALATRRACLPQGCEYVSRWGCVRCAQEQTIHWLFLSL